MGTFSLLRFERFVRTVGSVSSARQAVALSLMNRSCRKIRVGDEIVRDGIAYRLGNEDRNQLEMDLNLPLTFEGNLSLLARQQYLLIERWSQHKVLIRGDEVWLGSWRKKHKETSLDDRLYEQLTAHYLRVSGDEFDEKNCDNKVPLTVHVHFQAFRVLLSNLAKSCSHKTIEHFSRKAKVWRRGTVVIVICQKVTIPTTRHTTAQAPLFSQLTSGDTCEGGET
jgi:hypothetical protein